MKNLIGYMVFKNQEEFQKWQINNPEYIVYTVQPQILSIGMVDNEKEKYKLSMEGKTIIGIFVTYKYILGEENE